MRKILSLLLLLGISFIKGKRYYKNLIIEDEMSSIPQAASASAQVVPDSWDWTT